MARVRQALARLRNHLDYIGTLADGRNWLAGDHLSLADLAAAAHLSAVDYVGGRSVGGLSRRQGLVPAHQVAAVVPAAARRYGARHGAVGRLRRSRFLNVTSLADRLRQRAAQEGFSLVRIAPAAEFAGAGARLREFVALGRHGDMDWLADTIERRSDPKRMWPEARSAIMLAASYTPRIDPLARLKKRGTGVISVYALGRDYHDVVKGKLKHLGQWLAA